MRRTIQGHRTARADRQQRHCQEPEPFAPRHGNCANECPLSGLSGHRRIDLMPTSRSLPPNGAQAFKGKDLRILRAEGHFNG